MRSQNTAICLSILFSLASYLKISNQPSQHTSLSMKADKLQSLLEQVPPVKLSPSGKFKYIVIEARLNNQSNGAPIYFVRGDQDCEYHADNFDQFRLEIKSLGFSALKKNSEGSFTASKSEQKVNFACIGGGRIEHHYNNNKCFIYGYSKSFGRVDHSIAQKMISKALGYDLDSIKTSNQGY